MSDFFSKLFERLTLFCPQCKQERIFVGKVSKHDIPYHECTVCKYQALNENIVHGVIVEKSR